MSLPQPTKTRFRKYTLAGVDLLNHVVGMNVYETIMKPYITAKITILDNNNLLQNMNLVGGEPSSLAFDGGDGKIYEQDLYVINVQGERSNQSLRSQVYNIDLIGPAYFKDKGALVQQSFMGVTGTQAIQRLHSQFLGGDAGLNVLAQSLGMLSNESYIVSALKPFKAIGDIRKRLNYGQFKSGNTLYYRDAQSYVLGPLEALFAQLSAQETFIQEATWGKSWFDVVRAQNSIIAAVARVDHAEGGRGGMQDIASVGSQEKQVFDVRTKSLAIQKIASSIGTGSLAGTINGLKSAAMGLATGNHGGQPNYQVMDGAHNPPQTDQSNKTEEERLYAALAKNGPKITIKVPIQSGINCTVGKGINAKLLPAAGDQSDIRISAAGGLMLVTDLCHELKADDRQVNGVTVMQTVKGGVDS